MIGGILRLVFKLIGVTCCTPFFLSAQTGIEGRIITFAGEPVANATVQVADSIGTVADQEGIFSLLLLPGTYEIAVSHLGYRTHQETVQVSEGLFEMTVVLETTSNILDIVTITGSKFEKNIAEEVVSIDVISQDFIQRNHNTSLSDVVERIPGVSIIDRQANIRGGSGFTFGAGSRVAFIVDDQPLLAPELSDIKWNFIPLENVEQVEVIKGSSSVLYGSGGLNGVMNVRTATPGLKPYTSISTYAGIHHISDENGRRWYENNDRPFQTGLSLAHRQKVTPDFDLVVGANAHYQNNFLKGADERRVRTTVNTRFRPFKDKRVAIGFNANYMYFEEGIFFLPINMAEDAYVHILDLNLERTSLLNLDLNLDFFDKKENKHQVRLRHLNAVRYRTHNPDLPSGFYHAEYQFQRRFSSRSILTAGAGASHARSKSNLFSKSDTLFLENDTLINAPRESVNIGSAYLQWDRKIGQKLNLTMGLRWEAIEFENAINTSLPVFKGGLNYAVGETDFLRLSYGQGYRVPSLAERFVEDRLADGFSIFPNPDLKTETGWTAELGYKKTFVKDSWQGYFDVATFWMEFKDMNEFSFDLHRPDSVVAIRPVPFLEDFINYLGFKTVNLSRARIAGIEVSFLAEGKTADFPLRLWGGYTYSYPADLQQDPDQENAGNFLGELVSAFAGVDSAMARGLLKYRNLHTFRLDAEVDVGRFTFGVASAYHSFMHRLDDIIAGEGDYAMIVETLNGRPVVPFLNEFRNERRNGDLVFDLRLHYRLRKHRISLLGTNIFNREYAIRPAKMNAPLGLTIRWNYVL